MSMNVNNVFFFHLATNIWWLWGYFAKSNITVLLTLWLGPNQTNKWKSSAQHFFPLYLYFLYTCWNCACSGAYIYYVLVTARRKEKAKRKKKIILIHSRMSESYLSITSHSKSHKKCLHLLWSLILKRLKSALHKSFQ